MHKILPIVLPIALQGCVITTTNYIRNETESDLMVSVQRERQDLGWDREEKKTLTIKKHSICNLTTDVFYDTYFYITNAGTGKSTNVNAIRDEKYIYAISEKDKKQVVTITEADAKTKKLLKVYRDQCIGIADENN